MEPSENKLGQALAFLNGNKIKIETSLPKQRKDYMLSLRNRLEELRSNGRLKQVLTELPETICESHNPFLLNNDDFFLAFFSKTNHGEVCSKLFLHLNSCYSCFEIFVDVLRDFCGQLTDNREKQNV